jgi:hypothetical protein
MASPPATPNGFLASSRVKTMRPDRARAPGRVRPPNPSGGLSIFTPKPKPQEIICARFRRADSVDADPDRASHGITSATEAQPGSGQNSLDPATNLARCFLGLANLPSYPLDRLSRYEAILWRQAGQILLALDALDRRKPTR